MTYEEMFAKASERLCKAKVKGVEEHIAVQFNVSGEGCGSFYAEISEGKMDVQPYDYNDNDISVDVSSDALIAALEGKTADSLPFCGNESKIAVLKPVLASIPKARKAAAKPAAKAEKKPVAKAEKKPAAKKTTKKKAE